MVFGPGHDDSIDKRCGQLHLPRVQRAARGDAFDLYHHHAAGIADGHGLGEIVDDQRLSFHGDVARRVCRGAAQEGDVQGVGFVEQTFLAADCDQFDDVVRRDVIDLAALQSRIDESAQAHMGQCAGLACGDIAVEVRDHALWQVIGRDQPLRRQRAHFGDQAPVTADDAFEQALVPETVQPPVISIALPGGEDECQVARGAAVQKPGFQRA